MGAFLYILDLKLIIIRIHLAVIAKNAYIVVGVVDYKGIGLFKFKFFFLYLYDMCVPYIKIKREINL